MAQLQPESSFVDTPEAVSDLLSLIPREPTSSPSIYIDLEGINLCREGSISLLQLFISTIPHIYILDIHTLGHLAFMTPSSTDPSVTLKGILEDPLIPIAVYDIRSDNDALYHHFSINISNVVDLQLYEVATRPGPRRLLNGLSRSITAYCNLSSSEARICELTKQQGLNLFAPERGGSYEVFNRRPLPQELLGYCVQDVQYLPRLWHFFSQKLETMDSRWRGLIQVETQARIALCRGNFFSKGKHNALAPASFQNFPRAGGRR